jgi:hypothetical protein
MQRLNRVTPAGSPGDYKTYTLSAPLTTHYRVATCAEVDCEHWREGWCSAIDTSTELGIRQADYIVNDSGRSYTQVVDKAGGRVLFTFPAGQRCFRQHHVPLERDPVLSVRGGDWRASTGERFVHAKPEHWVEDFALHQDKIARLQQRG